MLETNIQKVLEYLNRKQKNLGKKNLILKKYLKTFFYEKKLTIFTNKIKEKLVSYQNEKWDNKLEKLQT